MTQTIERNTSVNLVTAEPSRRAVLVHRLLTIAAVLLAVAGIGYALIAGPPDVVGWGGADVNVETGSVSNPEVSVETDNSGATLAGGAALASEPAVVNDQEVVSAPDVDAVPELGVPPLATRFVNVPTTRILDTRTDGATGPVAAGNSAFAELTGVVPRDAISVVLSVHVTMAQGPGPIAVNAGGASVTALEVAKAGQMTTNLVLVGYLSGEPVEVTTAGGGHLIVDVVGYFTESNAASAGRFVPVATQRLARLVTEVDGRDAVVSPLANPALPASGVSSVLVRITADVGGEGGIVQLGQEPDLLPNTMMWAPTTGDDRTRQGVAVVSLSELDQLAFTYNGGSVLNLDVLGYFTDESALETESGLFQPRPDSNTVEIAVSAGQATEVDMAELFGVPADEVGAVPINIFAAGQESGELFVATPGQRRPGSATVVLTDGGQRFGFTAVEVGSQGLILIESDVDASVQLVIPGYFLR